MSINKEYLMVQVRKIIAGPGVFDLAVRLFEGSITEQRPVAFTVTGDAGETWTELVKLDGAQREDGTGASWNLRGYNLANHSKVAIFYNLAKKVGLMSFIT